MDCLVYGRPEQLQLVIELRPPERGSAVLGRVALLDLLGTVPGLARRLQQLVPLRDYFVLVIKL